MALENTDLLVAYRPSSKKHYKVQVDQFNTEAGNELPDGNNRDDILIWSGSKWQPGTIDGGTYA
tara:strand:+ start:469 stop:660 length:192 start_codon:yes stop_codon:yes gene_type:complete